MFPLILYQILGKLPNLREIGSRRKKLQTKNKLGGGKHPPPRSTYRVKPPHPLLQETNSPDRKGLTIFDIRGHDGPKNVFDRCAQTLMTRELKLGDS